MNMSEETNRNWIKSQYDNMGGDSAMFDEWLLNNADTEEFDLLMNEFLEDTECSDPMSYSQAYAVFSENLRKYERSCRKDRFHKVVGFAERIAAFLLLPVAALMFYVGEKTTEIDWIEANTEIGQKLDILLPDGTQMTLGPSSKMIYPTAFIGDQRKVFVIGSVYADIATDPKHPFVISVGQLEAIARGTEFQLSSYEGDSEVEVALVEGAVQLYNKVDHRDVIMHPGDIVCYDKKTGNFIRKNFAAGYYKEILENGGLQFVNQRFGDIAACLERHFGVTIHIDDSSIANERYFASFINNEGVDEILNVLNVRNYMNITRNGKIIHITKN